MKLTSGSLTGVILFFLAAFKWLFVHYIYISDCRTSISNASQYNSGVEFNSNHDVDVKDFTSMQWQSIIRSLHLHNVHTVCKICLTTTTDHISHFHLKLTSVALNKAASPVSQQRIEEALSTVIIQLRGVCAAESCFCPGLKLLCE